MLCPEINNFLPPKTSCTIHNNITSLNKTLSTVNLNNFYRSAIITCPDELNIPSLIEEALLEDSDYYKILNCSVVEFIDSVFIETFIRKGRLYCLSVNDNCINHNSVAITPDGILILNVLDYVYQKLGLEGKKRPHNFYEIQVDLRNIKQREKLTNTLRKLGTFNFYVSWEPHEENICPSTLAKYFCDKDFCVTQHALNTTKLSPHVTVIPSLIDVDLDEVVEFMGMIAHNANLAPEENYISTYYVPESTSPIETTRAAVMIVKGFMTSNIIERACKVLAENALTRDADNFWTAISIQTVEESLFRYNISSPQMFLSHNSSCNIFFTHSGQVIYFVSQLKYS